MADDERDDDRPFYSPSRSAHARERQPVPGERIWELRKGARVKVCEVRDDTSRGAGVDFQIFDDGWLTFAQRCADMRGAEFLAASYRQDFLRAGWTERDSHKL